MALLQATRSELTKQFTTAIWWILGIILVVWVGVTAGVLAATLGALASGSLGAQPPAMSDAAPAIVYSSATAAGYVVPLMLGVLLVTVEFRHKTLTPTLLATPRREVALGGKALAASVIGILYAALATVSAIIPGVVFFAAFGIDAQLGEPETWALIGRMLIAFILWTLIGLGIGTLVRNQVAGIVGVIVFAQFLEPILRLVANWLGDAGAALQFLPGAASDALVGASVFSAMSVSQAPQLEWWSGGLVMLAYAAVLLVIGHLVTWRRDVA